MKDAQDEERWSGRAKRRTVLLEAYVLEFYCSKPASRLQAFYWSTRMYGITKGSRQKPSTESSATQVRIFLFRVDYDSLELCYHEQ